MKARYGPGIHQHATLTLPPGDPPTEGWPVAVVIHGGYWSMPYGAWIMREIVGDIAARGWAAWNIEYRRLGLLGGGGGWPATFDDVARALDHLQTLNGLDRGNVITVGHSAGGHLALWAATHTPLAGVIALAGVCSLTEAVKIRAGGGAAARLMGGLPDAVPERYAKGDPGRRVPLGVRQVLVHGLADETLPPSVTETYAALALAAGDDVTVHLIPGESHRDLINPRRPGWQTAAGYLDAWRIG